MSRSSAACVVAIAATIGIVASIAAMYALGRSGWPEGGGSVGEAAALPFIAAFGIGAIVNAVLARKAALSFFAKVLVYLPVVLFVSFCSVVLGPFLG